MLRWPAVGICLILSWSAFPAERADAQALVVIDGQTVDLDGTAFRLAGILVPVPGEICTVRGQDRDCGRIARAQLLDLTAGAVVECRAIEVADQGPVVARCLANGYDLSYGMVYTGWAHAADAVYRNTEIEARDARRGMWNPGPNNYPDMR
ncbi:MAG: thermonuclease family protein [Alphaproteobacteria bacterium]|nr:thermonuclease family protein [Alphaproteobacteria bacterium]